MEEAAEADDVAIIDGGKIVARGTPNELKDAYSSDKLKLQPIDRPQVEEFLKESGIEYIESTDVLEINIENSIRALPLINKLEPYINGFEVIKGNMDNVFINSTGHLLNGGNK
jgi:multidrug/hemolysin transport system ATP-binding protein